MDKVSFILMKKPIEVSQIPRILASTIRPTCQTVGSAQPAACAFHATTKQSRKIVSRPVITKDFRFLGVGTRSRRSFKLHGLQITWVPSWTDISFSRSSRWSKHSNNSRIESKSAWMLWVVTFVCHRYFGCSNPRYGSAKTS